MPFNSEMRRALTRYCQIRESPSLPQLVTYLDRMMLGGMDTKCTEVLSIKYPMKLQVATEFPDCDNEN